MRLHEMNRVQFAALSGEYKWSFLLGLRLVSSGVASLSKVGVSSIRFTQQGGKMAPETTGSSCQSVAMPLPLGRLPRPGVCLRLQTREAHVRPSEMIKHRAVGNPASKPGKCKTSFVYFMFTCIQ
ncbi:hypothetical protein Y1Q_0000494 [Alligator mississippiensis]|uniref:Uncharacterized protein n=1 Tax=Alligator mississippiensis TaxID=8496 RepID=A0A151MBA1_ALLMI|nr:hypothetical protein Y1Q_0000494 [Alligator mississippiensis]